MTLDEYDMLFNILIAKFDVWRCYYYLKSDKWNGWKPVDYTDVLITIGELNKNIRKTIVDRIKNNGDTYCTTGGLMVGATKDGYCYITSTFDDSNQEIENLNDIKRNHIYSYVNYKQTLRLLKIISIKTS